METISPSALIWQDVIAQAVTGELVAAMNYEAMATLYDDPQAKTDALEHAATERSHAAAFLAEGRKIGVDASNNVNARHWKRLREVFMRCIAERDNLGCLIMQEIMLESFAVASYARAGKVAPASLGKTFLAIGAEEEEHVGHALCVLHAHRALDPRGFDEKMRRLHFDVMTILAEMLARECRTGHCEVCHDSCVKPSLSEISLSAVELRGASLQQYLKTLDRLGIPGEETLAWVAQLPLP